MNLTETNQLVALFALLLSIGNMLWAWISRPARVMGKRIDTFSTQVDEVGNELKHHDRRIQRVEDDIRHLPTKDDLQKIELKATAIKTELDLVARTVTRIDEYLRGKS